jgi:hypothetical protein
MIPAFIQRWLIIAALIAAAGATGFVKGIEYQQERDMVRQTQGLVYVAKKTAELQSVADKTATEVQHTQEQVRTIYKTIVKKEIEYVTLDPHAHDVLEPSFVLLYNAASLACDPSTSTCQSQASVAGDVTHAELIRKYNAASEHYQTCRVALEGYDKFYNEVREKVNSDANSKSTND